MYWDGDGLEGLGQGAETAATPPPWWQSLLTQAGTVYGQVQAVKSARQIADLNTQRIKQGLPPLTAAEIQSMSPTAAVSVGISPEVKQLLIYGGIGVAALVGLAIFMRRK